MTPALVAGLVGVAVVIGAALAAMRRLRSEVDLLRGSSPDRSDPGPGRDALTGLTDRVGLTTAIRAPRSRSTDCEGDIGIVAIEIAGFDQLTHTLGRDASEAVIVELAARLDRAVRSTEVLSRTGTDRFVVALEPPTSNCGASAAAARLTACIAVPILRSGAQLQLNAHVGIATGARSDFETLISNAEFAAGQARADESFDPVVYADAERRTAEQTFHRSQQLRSALVRGELHVAYQPIHRLTDGALSGVEALLRWKSPVLGPVSPVEFIPIAERTGAIVEIGAWVLERACSDLHNIAASNDSIAVSVNVSVHQLRSPGFVDLVRTVMIGSGLEPKRLQLEVTESALASPEEISDNLSRLRGLGVKIALDDVGTGYSSLSRLARLPIDTIKIDRSLLTAMNDPQDNATRVFSSLSSLGRSLDLDVVAEGVETEAQSALVAQAGCSHEQGFLRSRPMPVATAAAYARSTRVGY